MILTICPNPSIDCTIELNILNVGKLNRVENKVETYSGKGMNVAIGVSRLGEESCVTGFIYSALVDSFCLWNFLFFCSSICRICRTVWI